MIGKVLSMTGRLIALFCAGLVVLTISTALAQTASPQDLPSLELDDISYTNWDLSEITVAAASAITNHPSTGNVYIAGGENDEFFRDGTNYTVYISEITDDNGIGGFSYQWYAGVDDGGVINTRRIVGATSAIYAYDSANVPSGTGQTVMIAAVTHVDYDGFAQTFTTTLHSGHLISVTANGLAAGDTISWRVAQRIVRERGYQTTLSATHRLERNGNIVDLADDTSEYVLADGITDFDSPYAVHMVREYTNTRVVKAAATLTVGITSTITVSVARNFNLLRPTQGEVTLSLIGSVIRYGAEITVVTTGVSDVNGGGFLPDQYVWQVDGVAIESATSSVYRLQLGDILAAEGGRLSALATHRDSLGYVATLAATLRAQNRIDLGDRAVSIVAADGLIRGSTLSLSIVNRQPRQSVGDNVEWRYCKYPRAQGVGGDCDAVHNEQRGAAGNMYVLLSKPSEERPYIVAEGEVVQASGTSSFTAVLLGRIPPVHPLRLVGDPDDQISKNEYFFDGSSRFSLYMGEDVYAHGAILNHESQAQECSSQQSASACTGFFFIERSRQYFLNGSDERDIERRNIEFAHDNIYGYSLPLDSAAEVAEDMYLPDSNGYLSAVSFYESAVFITKEGSGSRISPRWTPGIGQIALGYGLQGDGGMTLTLYFAGGTNGQLVEDSFGEPLYVQESLENQYALADPGIGRQIPYSHIMDRIGSDVLTLYSPGAIEQAVMIIGGEVTIGAVATLSVNLLRAAHDTGSIEHTIFIGNRQVVSGDRLSAEYSYRLSTDDVLEMLINAPLNASLRYAHSKYRIGTSAGLNFPLIKELSSALTLTLNHNGVVTLQTSNGLLRGSTLSIDFGEESADDFYIDWWHCNAATLSVDGCVSAAGTTQGGGVIPDNGQAPFYVLDTVLSTIYSHIVARAGRYGAGGSDYLAAIAMPPQDSYTLSIAALSLNIVGAAEDLIAPGAFLYDNDSVFSVTVLLSIDISQTPYGAFVKETGDISWNLNFLDVGNNENNVTINNSEIVTLSGFNGFDGDSYAQILSVTINGIVFADSYGASINMVSDNLDNINPTHQVILRRRISVTIDIGQNRVTLDDSAGRVWDAPSYQWQHRQLSADSWQNIAAPDESFWTLSEEQINDEDFGPYVRLQLTNEEEITPGVVVTVRRYSNEILAGGIANPTPAADRIILAAADDSPCVVDAACDELRIGYVYTLAISDNVPLVNYLGQTLQMAYFNADADVRWQRAVGADDEYRDLTTTLGRELFRYTINVSTLIDEDGTSYGFFRAKVTDNRGQQRNPEDRATPESVFYTQSFSPDFVGTGRVYIPSPYATEIFADGFTYTANIDGIEDVNGVGNFSYQWYAGADDNGVISVQPIDGATSQSYIFDSADVSAAAGVTVLQVSVLHTDLAGYEQTFMATLHSGRILSLVANGLSAGDIISAVTITQYLHERGLGGAQFGVPTWYIFNQQNPFAFLRQISSLPGDTGYTLVLTDFNPSGEVVGDSVRNSYPFNYENGSGNEIYYSDLLIVNMSLTGALTISLSGGIVAENATVTVLTAGVSDANGGGFISYEWLRDGATIAGANENSYELTNDDLLLAATGKLSVRAIYRDSLGFETALSATLSAVDDSEGVGTVTIVGAPSFADGGIYTVQTSGVVDANGIGEFSYQWYVNINDNVSLLGEAGATYTIALSDFVIGDAVNPSLVLSVSVLHTDAAGYTQDYEAVIPHADNVLSGNVELSLSGGIVAENATVTVLTTGVSDANGGGFISYEWLRGDATIAGANEGSYELTNDDLLSAATGKLSARAVYRDSLGFETELSAALSAVDDSIGTGTVTIVGADSFVHGGVYTADTSGVVDDNGIGDFGYQWYVNVNANVSLLLGETGATYTVKLSDFVTDNVENTLLGLSVSVVHTDAAGYTQDYDAVLPHVDNVLSGNVELSLLGGIVSENATVTVLTAGVSDANGGGFISYEWLRGDVTITGASESSYALTRADLTAAARGEVSVRAIYRDSLGFETALSAALSAVDDSVGTGTVTIVGADSFVHGGVYTVQTSGVVDANGIGEFDYQWYVYVNDVQERFAETASVLTLNIRGALRYNTSVKNPTIVLSVSVVHTDAAGYTQDYGAARLHEDIPLEGEITVSLFGGIVAENVTVTILTLGVSDANDGRFRLYEWLRDGVMIDGANNISYALTRADLTAAARGELSARAIYRDISGYETTLSAILPAVDDSEGVGTVTIVGAPSFTDGGIYTVQTSGVVDANGIGSFDYQWYVYFNDNVDEITGATVSVYTLQITPFLQLDTSFNNPTVGLSVSVVHTDAAGYTQDYGAARLHEDIPLEGEITVSLFGGIVAENATVTILTLGVSDANDGRFRLYEWLRDGVIIDGANNISYALTRADLTAAARGELSARAIYRDSLGFETELSAVLSAVGDSVGTGAVTINGAASFTDGAVYTAQTVNFRDANGIGDFGYQWYVNINNSVTVLAGETGATYTVKLSDFVTDNVENTVLGLSVSVLHTDAAGYTQDYEAVLPHADNVLSGNVELSLLGGIVAENATVTILTAGVSDENGGGFISYEWLRGDTTIASANESGYELTNDDLSAAAAGKLSARAIYRDSLGFETALSAALSAVGDSLGTGRIYIKSPPLTEIFADGGRYTADISGIEDANGIGSFSYQWYVGVDGVNGISLSPPNEFGYGGDSLRAQEYRYDSRDSINATGITVLQVSVTHTDLAGYEQTFMATLHSDNIVSIGVLGITAGARITSEIVEQYVIERGLENSELSYSWVSQLGSQVGAADSIGVNSFYDIMTEDFSPKDSIKLLITFRNTATAGTSIYFSDVIKINEPLSGGVSVSLYGGVVAENATVTILTAGVSDANGGGFISYEWLRGDVTIAGANESDYELTNDDLLSAAAGKLSVRALYRDDLGFETALSAALSAVGDSIGTGTVTIVGADSFADGEIYTVQTSGVVDANGIGEFDYQWYANINNSVTVLAGETAATYVVKLSDFVAEGVVNTVLGLSVSVVHTDAAGYTQDYEAVLPHVDNVLSGNVELSLSGGVVSENATVTVLTAGVSDANGGGFISYEWLRGNATITGANESRYELTSDDLLSAATGKLSARAIYRDSLGFETELSAALSAVGDSVGTGTVTIVGVASFAEGGVYTADTSGVVDDNGIGDFGYQWYVNINNSVTMLVGETGATYTMELSDFVIGDAVNPSLVLSVSVLHTDAAGYTQDYEAVLPHADNVLSGNVELSLLGGIVAENATVTVLTANVSDANGGGFISYEWWRDSATIAGASASDYELTSDDLSAAAAGKLSVRALYRDSLGFETALSAALSALGDSIGTGTVTIVGAPSFASGEVYTADTSGVVDDNGIGDFGYQWYANINNSVTVLSGETAATYVVKLSDFVTDNVENTVLGLSVLVLHTDAAGYPQDYEAVLPHVDNVLSGNVELSLSGNIVSEGATVTLITAGVSDANGGGFISYEWLRDGATITGANESGYELTRDDLLSAATGKLSARAIYRDDLGFNTALSAALLAVGDSVGTGTVTIVGASSFASGEVYTADTGGVVDDNGIGEFSYQWYVNINDNVSLLLGETAATYTVKLSDFVTDNVENTVLGLSVSVLHTDAAGYTQDYEAALPHADNILSGNVELSLLGGIVAENATVTILTASVSDENGGGFISYEWLRGDVTIAGANEGSYELTSDDLLSAATGKLSARAIYRDSLGFEAALSAALSAVGDSIGTGTVTIVGAASFAEGEVYTADTSGVVDENGIGDFGYQWYVNINNSVTVLVGETGTTYTMELSDFVIGDVVNPSLVLSVSVLHTDAAGYPQDYEAALPHVDNVLSGNVELSLLGGIVSEGAMVTVLTAGVSDANDGGFISYEWLRDGVTIAGANESRYELTNDDLSAAATGKLSARALYRDSLGFETELSAVLAAVGDSVGTGTVTIVGVDSFAEGAVYTAQTVDFRDANGIGSFNYQWYVNINNSVTVLVGETGATYTMELSDFVIGDAVNPSLVLGVSVLHTDAAGYTQDYEAVLPHADNVLSGNVELSLLGGIVTENATVTILTAGVSDANGGGFISYEWLRGDVTIAGANEIGYELTNDDLLSAATGKLSARAIYRDSLGFETELSAALSALGDSIGTGTVTIVGAPSFADGGVYTADTSDVVDDNGIGEFDYQWYANINNSVTVLGGETGATYTMELSDFVIGDAVNPLLVLSVSVLHTDAAGYTQDYEAVLPHADNVLSGNVELSLLGGIVTENATVTILTAGVSDANGGGFISYEWLRGDVTIAGANEIGYELTNDDLTAAAAGKLSARAIYRDSLGFETALSAALSAVGDSVGIGTVTIVGAPSFTDGGIYTVQTSGVVDANGIGDFSYQWYVNINNSVTVLAGETGATYTMELSDFVIGDAVNPSLVLSVSVLHTDAAGYTQDYEADLPHVDNVLSGNVELSLYGGVVAENATVTILTASVSDANGGGFISYEWLRDGATITGANESGYELTRDDLLSAATGKLSARAKYRDSLGFETELSAALLAVGDSIGTGTVTIIGAPSFADGGVYTADTSGVVDDNGIGDFGYQWYVNVNANVSLLLGETAATYTVKLSDFVTDNVENTVLGLSVSVLHTDAAGYTQDYEAVLPHADSVLSGNVELSLYGGVVAENATVTILTASVSDANGGGFISYEWLRGDVTIAGANESSYELTNDDLSAAATGKLSARAIYRDDLGFETELSAALLAVGDSVGTGTVTIVGAPSFADGEVYTADTSGVVDDNGIGDFGYQWYANVNANVSLLLGETAATYTVQLSDFVADGVVNTVLGLSVSVLHTDAAGYTRDYAATRLHADNVLSGNVELSLSGGIVAEGATVTLITAGVSDANGGGFISYKWLRDGVTIAGANASDYELTNDDLLSAATGKLSVRALYRDNLGFETELSAILPAAGDSVGTGEVTINGADSFAAGEVYTADTSGVRDENGIGGFVYQWYVNINDNVSLLSGEKNATYKVQLSDFVAEGVVNTALGLSVSVVHTDAAGYTRDYNAVRLHADNVLSGNVELSLLGDIVVAGATVMLITASVSDANGGGFISYEWLRDGVTIAGANEIGYELTSDDLSAVMAGELSARAIYRDSLGFETELSAELSAVGDSVGTGAVTINGAASFAEGEVYTADTSGVRDDNGIGGFVYQWYANVNANVSLLSGETAATYTVQLSNFVADGVVNTVLGLSVSVVHTDAAGYTRDYNAVRLHADNVLSGNVELSLLGDIVVAGATVTLITAGVSNNNGGGFISYEWLRDGVTIVGANASDYELTNDDLLSAATGELSARAIYRDSLGFETELSAALSAVGDSIGTGTVTIIGAPSFTEGAVYTAQTVDFRDANGIGSFDYQWYVNINNSVTVLASATAAIYTMALSDFVIGDDVLNPSLVLGVSVLHTDAAGYPQDYEAALPHADNVLSGNVELSLLGGIVAENATVTILTAGVSDNNGGGFISYEWLRGDATIAGEDASDYELTNDDLSAAAAGKLSARAIYRDSLGFETALSAALSAVGDSIGTGTVTIVGADSFAEGGVYTADTSGVVDDNGIGDFSYQWYANVNDNVSLLLGETGATYTVKLSDFVTDNVENTLLGLSVSVLHTDAAGYTQDYEAALPHADNVLSGNVELSLSDGIVAEGAIVTVLTASVSDANGGGFISYEWLRDGATIVGANENRYELTNDDLLAAATGELSVRALYRDSLGFETELSAILSATGDSVGTGSVTINGAASFASGEVYTADISGVVDANGIGGFVYQWYVNINDNVSLLSGETNATYKVQLSDFVADGVVNTVLGLSVSVLHTDAAGYTRDYAATRLHADNVLSGNVELSLSGGIVAEGATVTLITAGVSDANGGGFISYKWLRDGVTIAGANASDYELTNDDLLSAATGKLSVRALYRDNLGFETELSAILPAAGDSVGTGEVTINGADSFAAGEVYTADTSGVRDENGIGGFVYQWYVNINDNVSLLSGEKNATYKVQLSDFVAEGVVNTALGLSVSVVHTDAAGYTRDYNAVRLHADNVLSGNVELSLLGDIVVAGATVMLITASVSDANGGGFISYEWLRDGVTIAGANEIGYELTSDDLSAVMAGELSARAIYRDSLGFETELSAELSAVGDSVGTGAVTINGAASFAEGEVYTADTSGVRDDNGIGGFVYQWYANVNANVSLLSGETAATYTVQLSNFVADGVVNTVLGLSVSVVHTDAAGYTRDYNAVRLHADNVLSGNVELSLLGDIVVAGATVTLITAGVSNNNGGGFISYEWLRDGVTIVGANASDYELTNDDLLSAATGELSVWAIYRDSLGFETELSAALSAVGDSIGTGTVTIIGAPSFTEGAVYTAQTVDFRDANGIGSFDYQWYVNINNSVTVLASATAAIYTMALSDFVIGDDVLNPSLVLGVSVLHTDAAGYPQDYEAALPHADNVLSGNVELSLLGGIVAENATVTILTAGVSDNNGGGFISYEWLRGDATIAGEDASDYELTNDDLSAAAAGKLSARAIYRDSLGFETALSAALSAVGDSIGTGTVTIVGADSFAEGGVYTADTSGVVDDNGIGDFSYQWYANVNDNVSLLLGETGATYTVKLSDFVTDNVENTLLGLSVSVLHTDAAGYTQDYEAALPHADNVLSGNVELSLSDGIVAEGAIVTVLTASVSDENGGGFISYEWLRGDATITGANESRYELTSDDLLSAATGKLSARALYRDDLGFNTELSATLSAVGDSEGTGFVTIEGAASFAEGGVYTVQTSDFTDANGIGDFSYQWYANVNDNVSLLSGETAATYTVKLSDFVADGVINTVLGLSVLVLHTDAIGLYTQDYDAILLHNDLPLSGALKVSLSGGVVAENATVIVLTAGVSDANGGGFVSTEYEWLRGNATITGANESRYELTSDDLSAAAAGKLSARALYRDDLGFNTELSAVLPAAGDSVGTGAVTINGAASFTEGAVYTAQTVNFRDANGIGDFGYQWYVNINNSVTVLVGKTGAIYTMALSDFVIGDAVNPSLVLGVSVVHTDGANNDQVYEAVLSHVDIPLTGSLTISLSGGVVAENVTVTILTAGVSDANGGGFISYEWLRGDITITGASVSRYELTEADLTTAARGGLSARALYRDSLGFETALSAVLSAVDDRHELESGKVEIRLTGYVFNQNEAMAHIKGIAASQIAEVSYQWQTGIGAEFAEFRNVGEHGDLCLLESGHFNPQDSLRVIANITGISGHIVQLTSAVVPINFDVAGDVIIRVIGNGPVVAGAVLSADISNLYDQNGELLVGENIWLSGASDAPVAVGFTYTLVAGDIDNGRVKYRGVVNDPALFATTFENEVNTGRIDSRQVRVLLESINVAADDGIARALNDHLNTAADGLHINGATVEDSAQLAKALLSGREQNGNRFWGINEFSLNSSEGAPGEEWSWWVRGYRTHLKGTPSVGGETFDYNGDYKAFYAGLDRRLHRDVIIGMILSSDLAKLDVDWNTGVTSEGSIRQDMLSIVPYAEWTPDDNTALRIYGGYGRGDLRINVNDVETMTDSERKILGLQGIYRLSLSTNWEMSWRGDVSYVRGAADEVSRVLEGVTARHGESRLNWEIAHTTIDPGKAYWRKFLNLRWRRQFGELDNVSLYDIGGGFSWAMPSHNFRFGVSGQWQLNTAEHMRESFDIYVTFGPGKINHTMRTRYSGADGGFNHRYEIGMVSDWGISTIYTNVYAERRYGGELYWGGDMEVEF